MSSKITRWLGFLLSAWLLIACSELDFLIPTPDPTATPITPTVTSTATATRIWFPATQTPLPQPTRPTLTPTPDQRPIDNLMLFEDDLSEQTRWTTSLTNYGSVAYGKQELTIAINQERQSLYSFFLETVPSNYYLEMMVSPSLCKGEDLYGIAFRVQSNSDFYRLVMRCDGQLRVDLVRGGGVVTVSEQRYSGQLRPGPLQSIPVALWINGSTVQIFIDDVYQLSVNNLMWTSGGVGVYARSAAETALTVNFSDFVVREGDTFPPTPVPTWTALPSPTKTPLKRP